MLYNLAKPDFDVEPPKSVWASNLYVVKTSEPNFSQSIENRPFLFFHFEAILVPTKWRKEKKNSQLGKFVKLGVKVTPKKWVLGVYYPSFRAN